MGFLSAASLVDFTIELHFAVLVRSLLPDCVRGFPRFTVNVSILAHLALHCVHVILGGRGGGGDATQPCISRAHV